MQTYVVAGSADVAIVALEVAVEASLVLAREDEVARVLLARRARRIADRHESGR